ncbi:Uncharacterised protein [Salmonella enterica subsp. enterica serovar Bovismorbificans]|uniref:Uncharacterized protein n=1 Tax=Salmonella enterica subsp. enterica serovar Bovismorbificans TaxID=58097 RepID=A0A655BV26_SALET|nr:Uncharacterised protein [Salmonella enterica subsp. enterica serovar Bovismorbificans]
MCISAQLLGIICGHIARRDGVYIDIVFRPLVRHQTRYSHYAAFRRGIRRNANAALEGKHRRDINNFAAVALGNKMFCRRLRHKEHALDVQVHDVIPVFFREINRIFTTDQTRVIHQNINMTVFRHRPFQ